MIRSTAVWVLVALACACGPASTPTLTVTADTYAIDGRTQRAVLRFKATGGDDRPGKGSVALVTAEGLFIEGNQVTLIDGVATATFSCDPTETPSCQGWVRLAGAWSGETATVNVKVGTTTQPTVEWKVTPTGVVTDLYAARTAADGSIWAVGAEGTALHRVNDAWVQVPTETSASLRDLWLDDTGAVLAVGDQGTIVGLSGDHFALLSSGPAVDGGTPEAFVALDGVDGAHLFVAAASGAIYPFDGVTLGAPARLVDQLTGLRASPVTGVLWASAVGGLYSFDGSTWARAAPPMTASWSLLRSTSEGLWADGYRASAAQGSKGVLVGKADTSFEAYALGDAVFTDVYQPANSNERWALTDTGVLRKIGDEAWTRIDTPMGGFAMAGTADALVIVGAQGTAIQRR